MRSVGMAVGLLVVALGVIAMGSVVLPPILSIYANAVIDLFEVGHWNGPNPFSLAPYGADTLFTSVLVLVAGFVVIAISFRVGKPKARHEAEDSQRLQEIHRGLTDLDKRVEALETILLERARPLATGFERVER